MNKLFTLLAVTMAVVLVASANAAIEITPDHVVSGTVTGKLIVIDVPTPTVFPYLGDDGDSNWTDEAAGVLATVADNGFQIIGGAGIQSEEYGDSNWEPDGTPFGQSKNWAGWAGTIVHFNFNLADSGIDLPDGSVINAIYTTWNTRKDDYDYRYTEGAASETNFLDDGYKTAAASDLILRWTDSDSATHDGNFERIFTGPITVEGGDGFTLQQYRQANTAHLDAVILDVTIVDDGHRPPDNFSFRVPYGEGSTGDEVKLSWINLDPSTPGDPVYVDVYFGTDPSGSLVPNVSGIANINTAE
jgi:hypothetical protein